MTNNTTAPEGHNVLKASDGKWVDTKVGNIGSIQNIDIIKRHEGLRLEAYLCPAGVLTIGYGHTRDVEENTFITEAIAEKLLREDVEDAENAIDTMVTVPLNQNQYDALVSFVFNVGSGNFRDSTLLRVLNKGLYLGAANEFKRWIYANKEVLNGLVIRRREEANLFIGVEV